MKNELNHSYNGGGIVYLLQSELSTSTRQYALIPEIVSKLGLELSKEIIFCFETTDENYVVLFYKT